MGATAGMMLTMGNATSGFVAQQNQARALTSGAGFDTQLAKLQASDAIARGEQEANVRALQSRRAIGAQRAGLAASGVDVNSGTASDLQTDEARFSALDQQTIRNNAAREAWGYTTQANLNATGATNEADNLKAQSYGTLLTGVANTYGLYRNTRGTTSRRGG